MENGTLLESGRALRPAISRELERTLAITDRERDRRTTVRTDCEYQRLILPRTLVPFVMLAAHTIARERLLQPRWLLRKMFDRSAHESPAQVRRTIASETISAGGVNRVQG